MSRLELVTGGARSGKSALAERRAAELARPGGLVAYIATAVVTDAEMAERIAGHRGRRPAGWRTLDAPTDLGGALAAAAAQAPVVLVDCLAVWSSNRLLALGDPDADADTRRSAWRRRVADLDAELGDELAAGLDAALAAGADIVLVTNEVGLGVVPPTPLGRAYRDLLGRLNQRAAARADAVHLVVAGIAVDLRQLPHAPVQPHGDAA